MNVQESFVMALDGSEIYLRKWLPEGDPRGIIQIAHGMTEHAGVYPEANIPVVQISVNPFLSAKEQFEIGEALKGLGQEDILVLLPFQHVKEEIKKADISFVNLESAFTTKEKKAPGQLFWIKSDPSTLQAIKNTGYDIVNIGNNHTLDYGQDGLLDTISHVEKLKFPYTGAGKNAKDAYTAREMTVKGKKFKFLSFVRFMPDSNWVAGENKPGVANGYDLNLVTKTIKEQKQDADYLIVYMHWGVEKSNRPVEYQKQYVPKMVEAGANAIVGSHPHWLQGFEYYNKVPIAYSLGNFLFPSYVNGKSAETGVLTLTFKGKDVQMSFNPYIIRNNQVSPVNEEEKKKALQYLQTISTDVEIDDTGKIKNKRN